MIINDDILIAVETEAGLRGLFEGIVGALRFRAQANTRDAETLLVSGYATDSQRQSHEADARIRNAELLGFVIENLHSYEPPAVAAAAVSAEPEVESTEPTGPTNEQPSELASEATA